MPTARRLLGRRKATRNSNRDETAVMNTPGGRDETKRRREGEKEKDGDDEAEEMARTPAVSVTRRPFPTVLMEMARSVSGGQDGVCDLQESVETTVEAKFKMVEERMKNMEEQLNRGGRKVGDLSVVSGASSVLAPANEDMLKENLRKFVAERVFPSWKFIFRNDLLQQCVVLAISKNYITMPPGLVESNMTERYSHTVRGHLDGCRAYAQTLARKKYLCKCECRYTFVNNGIEQAD
jgi:hypothetical protein